MVLGALEAETNNFVDYDESRRYVRTQVRMLGTAATTARWSVLKLDSKSLLLHDCSPTSTVP